MLNQARSPRTNELWESRLEAKRVRTAQARPNETLIDQV